MTSKACDFDLVSLLPVELFKALASPTRIGIVAGLAAGGAQQTVSEVARRSAVDVSVVSRHLRELERAGVLESVKRGKEVLFQVRVAHLVTTLRKLADGLEACCPDGVCSITDDEQRSTK